MKVGVISDLHANLPATETILDYLNSQNVGAIFCAGDVVGFGANPNEVIELIKQQQVSCVMGNYDNAVAYDEYTAGRVPSTPRTEELKQSALVWTQKNVKSNNKEYLKSLPLIAKYTIEGKSIKILHAGPNHLDEWIVPEDELRLENLQKTVQADIIIIGHTHRAFACTVRDTLILNPGAVGRSLNGDTRASSAILDTETRLVELISLDYDIESAVRSIQESGMPQGVADLIRYGVSRIEKILE